MSKPTADDIQALLRSNVGTAVDFDFKLTAVGDDYAELVIPFAKNLTRLGGTISGPVMMTAADTAMYAAVIHVAEQGEYGVTSHMNVEFLRRPPAAGLRVTARILRAGRRQISCLVEIVSEADNRLVAHVTGAYVLFASAKKTN